MPLVSSKCLGQLRLMCADWCGLTYGLLGKGASRRRTRVDRCVWGVRMESAWARGWMFTFRLTWSRRCAMEAGTCGR